MGFTMTAPRFARTALALACSMPCGVGACGPDSTSAEGSGSGQSATGSSATASSSGPTAGASSEATASGAESGPATSSTSDSGEATTGSGIPGCPDLHVGSLTIDEATDLDALRTLGRVAEGAVRIENLEVPDLEFLECLHAVDYRVEIYGNPGLTSLDGLANLTQAGALSLGDNPNLVSLGGASGLTELEVLEIGANSLLPSIDLPGLERIGMLSVGGCTPLPGADNPALTGLSGLSGVEDLAHVVVGDQSGVVSLAKLHELAASGDNFAAWIARNPSLPYAEVEQLLQLASPESSIFSCGNLGEPKRNSCQCPPGGG